MINHPDEYKRKVDLVSNLLGLKCKYRLISDHCPVYFVGKYNTTPIIFFGLNPGHSEINSPIEDKDAKYHGKDIKAFIKISFHTLVRMALNHLTTLRFGI